MMGAVVIYLLATGLLPRAPTIPPDGKQEGLSCAAFDIRNTDGTKDESNLALTIAPMVTRKGKQRILHHPSTPKRQDNPTYGATRNNANPNTCGTTSTDSKRENKGARAHRNLCSPLKRPPAGRQLLVRADIKTHTQPRYDGSQTFSANRRNS